MNYFTFIVLILFQFSTTEESTEFDPIEIYNFVLVLLGIIILIIILFYILLSSKQE